MSLELTELYGLKQVVIRGYRMPRQVGNRSGHAQNAIKRASGKGKLLHGAQEYVLLRRRKRTILPEQSAAEARITGNTC